MSPSANKVSATEHERYREDLSAYLDRQLEPARMAEVEAHLVACEACREELASLEQTVLWLRQLPPVRLPRSFVIPVAKPAPQRATTLGWTYGYLRLATALAMALLVLVVSGDLFLQFGLGPQAPAALPAPVAMQPAEFGIKAVPTEPSELTLGLAGEEGVAEPTPTPDTTLRVAYAPVESPSPQSVDAGAKALTPEGLGIGETIEYTPTYAVVARESPEQPTPETAAALTSEGQRGQPPSVAPQPTPEPTATPEPTLVPQPTPTLLAVAMERGAGPVPTVPPPAHEYALVQYEDTITPLLRMVEVVLLVLVVVLVGLTWWARRSRV